MAQPVYITPAGSLGTIPEGKFFQVPIQAYDPDDPDNPDAVYYLMVAGELPEGIQCTKTGLIEGVPKAIASLQGVPTEVGQDVTSKFVVRAYTESSEGVVDRLRDRTFTLTVTGQDIPDFVTPAGNIGSFFDGTAVEIDIEFTDTDPDETVTVQLAGGTLPPGLTISSNGVISGIIQPLVGPPNTAVPGFDLTNFDVWPFDFSTRSASRNYQFIVEITDGKDSNLRTFEIYVYSRDSVTGDDTDFTGDITGITADVTPTRIPLITTPEGNIGTYRHNNFFAYKFSAVDLDGDPYTFDMETGDSSLPPNLVFDPNSGWLYGLLADEGLTERTFNFNISVFKTGDVSLRSRPYEYSMNVIGDIENNVTWLVPDDLGTIDNGSISTLYVQASTTADRVLRYRISPGSASRLPQGLSLLESGSIAGRVSFNTFTLDGGSTTFDKEFRTRLTNNETTFDLKYDFIVEAYSDDGLISVTNSFTITVTRQFDEPYVGLYIKAMPPQNDRDVISELLWNQDLIPVEYLYRPQDPYFGRSTSVKYVHAYGLGAATLADYVTSMDLNHYRKTLILGEIKTAQALDADGNVLYEVVYSAIQDTLVNNQGTSVSEAVTLPYPINEGDSTEIDTVYPNSLANMRDRVIDGVGQITPGLPLWMTTKQPNGQVLGFTPAWVICYTIPGKSRQIAYNISEYFDQNLNEIDFIADRYELEGQATRWWTSFEDSTLPGNWASPSFVTFDRDSGDETTFDDASLRFTHPVDVYGYTDEYDKYLMFPRTNILG